MLRRKIELQIVDACRRMHAAGWVANHDGNISAKLSDGRIVITPSAMSKACVETEDLVLVDAQGQPAGGRKRPCSELPLHLAAYAARPEIRVVIHAHPPTATGFAVAKRALNPKIMAEPQVSLGDEIPTVAYRSAKLGVYGAAIGEGLQRGNALLLLQHGVLAVGPDVETAFLRLELVEHLAKIQSTAEMLLNGQPLPQVTV